MPWWIIILLAIYLLACLFLIFVILIQSGGKGGGLSSLGASSDALSGALGATGAEKALNRLTTYSAVTFMVLAIVLSVGISKTMTREEQIIPETAPPEQPFSTSTAPLPADTVVIPPAEETVPVAPANDAAP